MVTGQRIGTGAVAEPAQAEFRTWLDRGACRRRRCSYSKQPKYSLAAISGPEAVSALDAGKIAAFMVDHSRDRNINEYERAA